MVDELKRRLKEEEEDYDIGGGGGITLPPIDRETLQRGRSSSTDLGEVDGKANVGTDETDEELEGGQTMEEVEVLGGEDGGGGGGAGDLMAQPEFQGMWEAKGDSKLEKKKAAAIAEGMAVGTQFAKSKMDVDILNK